MLQGCFLGEFLIKVRKKETTVKAFDVARDLVVGFDIQEKQEPFDITYVVIIKFLGSNLSYALFLQIS